ncbi:unnamed protein product [Bemisia tabaci]|uniref:Uncharacterized protein n=1 Tax=Bemisia tabaci TaxID=7038 RepID=A0A9P0AN10_BEMTA|nr:unnamed protein product [Bemisia tabaci]
MPTLPAFVSKCSRHGDFKGVWYEVERSFYVFEITSMCTTFNFTSKPDGNLRVLIKTVSRLFDLGDGQRQRSSS